MLTGWRSGLIKKKHKMSIICIKRTDKEIQVAAEGLVIDAHSWEKMEVDRHKLFQLEDGTILGGVGTSLTIQMFVDFCSSQEAFPVTELGLCAFLLKFKQWVKERFDRDLEKDDSDYVMVFPHGSVFTCTCEGGIRAVEILKENFALGLGADYAKGAMDFGATAEEACKAVAKRFVGVNDQVVSYTVPCEGC